jgi:Acyclic terpene utilisation family protein AtuA
MSKPFRIGSGAGFSGDRLEPAVVLAERGALDFLALECLAERTIALAQLRKRRNAAHGYDPLLERRMELILPLLKSRGVRLISNFGAANPLAAADAIVAIARRRNIPIRVAAVTGDDVLASIEPGMPTLESGTSIDACGELVSANAYLGAEALMPALDSNADVIVTGRVADPSLFVAPMAHHFGWALDDYPRLARATSIGHLLECAGQLCGGYFAEPGPKPVTGMAQLGFPYADVDETGEATVGKVEGTGGEITVANTKEQLLYEVTDPFGYITPDVIADFSGVRLSRTGPDRVHASGATGRSRPQQLKVSVGYLAGYVGEGEIGYAGANAVARAQLAGEIIRARLQGEFSQLRIELIGATSMHGKSFEASACPYEVRLRVAARARTAERAMIVGEEVEALYTNGPGGGGGARKYVHEQVGVVSTLIDRERVPTQFVIKEWTGDAKAA